MRKLKYAEVKLVRAAMLKEQKNRCALCHGPLHATARKAPVLDHCHDKGHIRGVLCTNCNAMEGKIKTAMTRAAGKVNRLAWLEKLVEYLKHHEEPQVALLHPTFKTEEEKRLARNKKARLARAKLKAQKG